MYFYGLDLGIKTGALIELRENIDEYRVISSWTKGPKTTEFVNIVEHMDNILKPLPHLRGQAWLSADWSPYEVFLRGNRVAIQMKAFAFGYLFYGLQSKGFKTVFTPPAAVRKFFDLPKNADKLAVQSSLKQQWKGEPIRLANEHEMDALVLAYLLRFNYSTLSKEKS